MTPDIMWADISALNLVKAVPALQMPVFFFLGRHDHVVAAETSTAYFNVLTAPSKTLLCFEESGQEPPVEEPVKFNAAMVELVRPTALSSSSGPLPFRVAWRVRSFFTTESFD